MIRLATIFVIAATAAACSPERDHGGAIDAPSAPFDGPASSPQDGANKTDATVLQPTMFPISSGTSAPVIAGVTVSCHAMYSPKIVRVYVVVTDPQGATDRATGSGTLKLPDGTNVALALSEPYSASQYDVRVKFGSGENLTEAQFTDTCAAAYVELSLTMPDKTGHVTIAPSVVVPPQVGGTL